MTTPGARCGGPGILRPVAAVLKRNALRRSRLRRAPLLGSATVMRCALEAAYMYIEECTDIIRAHGNVGLLTRCLLGAFIICGVVGLGCGQLASHGGPPLVPEVNRDLEPECRRDHECVELW